MEYRRMDVFELASMIAKDIDDGKTKIEYEFVPFLHGKPNDDSIVLGFDIMPVEKAEFDGLYLICNWYGNYPHVISVPTRGYVNGKPCLADEDEIVNLIALTLNDVAPISGYDEIGVIEYNRRNEKGLKYKLRNKA